MNNLHRQRQRIYLNYVLLLRYINTSRHFNTRFTTVMCVYILPAEYLFLTLEHFLAGSNLHIHMYRVS